MTYPYFPAGYQPYQPQVMQSYQQQQNGIIKQLVQADMDARGFEYEESADE